MSGICDICKRSECAERQDGAWNCDKYLSYASKDTRHESNYEKLFGTPERAARTLERAALETCDYCAMVNCKCSECFYEPGDSECYNIVSLLEWLKSKDKIIDESNTIRNELIDSGLLKDDA